MDKLHEKISFENLKLTDFPIPDFFSESLPDFVSKHLPEHRNRLYPPELTISGALFQAINNTSMNDAVAHLNSQRIANGQQPASNNTASYSDAKKKLPTEIFQESALNVAKKTTEFITEPFCWKGFKLYAIDGSTFTMDDTSANQKNFPQHKNQKKGAGFPIARIVVLESLSTGMIVGANYGSYKGKNTGEMTLSRPLIATLEGGDLLLGDRYYPSFFTMASLQKQGIEGVFQIQGSRNYDFRLGEKLGDLDHIVCWDKPQRPKWMSEDEYNLYPDQIRIREVDVTAETASNEQIVLVTTLIDSVKYPKQALADLYKRRWEIETALKEIKDSMGMHHINAKTPESVKQTVWSYFLAYNLLKWYMLNIAMIAEIKLKEISLANTIYVLIANFLNIVSADKDSISFVRAGIVIQILSKRVPHRPGRFEPRKVKRRPKPHKRLNECRKKWKEKRAA